MSSPIRSRVGWCTREDVVAGVVVPAYKEFRARNSAGVMSLQAYIRTDASDTPLSAAVWRTGKGWDDVDLPSGLSLEEVKLHIEALLALEN